MSQQEVMYGQISQQMHSSEAPKEGDFLPQPVQRPPEYVGFVPFHQQQGQQRHPEPRQLEPSLSLSLERPDAYGNVQFQQQQGGPLRPAPARPFEVRPSNAHPFDVRQDAFRSFNLEQQPFQHTEQPNHPSYNTNHGNIPVAHQTHHGMDSEHDAAAHMIPTHNGGGSSEQADDGMHLQIVPASEFLPHDQGGHQQHYPPPSASHDAVIQDPELFMTTLDNFLAALGTRLTVPKVGGKEMNLHAFYCEVTARGGLEQVIRSAQWKELSEVLDVPRPSVSTSFVLRKHYTSLLFHYEQVYYFSAEGKLLSPPVPLPAPSPVEPAADIGSPYEVPPEIGSMLKKRKRKLDPMQVFGVDPAASIGTIATGAINGKFDEGYFVTVVVGTEKLTGVLYHLSAGKNVPQFASVPSLLDGIGSDGNTPGLEIQLYGKKRKERVRKRDPNAPKRTRTGYNIFFKEQRARLKQLYPETKGHGKKVIEMWSKLPENQKALYVARGNQEREKYLTEYREKMRLQSQVSDGANVAAAAGGQPVGEHDHGTYDVSHDYHVSLDVESDIQSGHPHVSEMDHVYHGYHANGPQPHLPESEKSGGHLVSEQAYEVQEDEGDYPQEPVSEEEDEEEEEEEDDAELEDAYEGEEDETVYPGSEKIFEGQDGSEYQVSDRDYNMPEGAYPLQANESRTYESRVHSASVNPKQPYYGQDHTYTYAPTLPQQGEGSVGSARMASLGQVPYQMQDNGQVIYPHLQQGRPEASVDNTMSQQHYLTQDRYVYPHARQGQTEEALGLPVTQDQGSFRRQDEGSSYLAPFHQNQAMGSNIQTRQVPSEQAYQDRYAYPIHMPYAQMYTRPPHAYPPRFPYPPYPMQLSETQALHYGHAYAAQVHQPQASIPDVSGVGAPLQVYQTQDGGHAYHAQDGNSVPVFKHNSNK